MNQSINQSNSQSISQSINQSINQSVSQSVSQSVNQSVSQSINQSINQSVNQSVNQSIGGTTKKFQVRVQITDHFTYSSVNVIYCKTCALCKKLYIGETGRRLGDRFRELLRDVEKDGQTASKPIARYFNLPNNSNQHMAVCGLSLHQGSTESRKTLEQKFIFQIGTLNPNGINERFSFNWFIQLFSRNQTPTNSVAPSFCI